MYRIAALITALMMFSVAAKAEEARPGWARMDTAMPYKALTERLSAAIKAEKMLRVSRASASAGAKGRKIDIAGNMVVGVFRNDFAVRMLEASIDAGIEAPIRFYVTENADGTGRLTYRTPTSVFEPYMSEGGEKLKTLAAELDAIFEAIAKRATVAE